MMGVDAALRKVGGALHLGAKAPPEGIGPVSLPKNH